VAFYGAEGGGKGTDSDRHAATLTTGDDEVFHGMRTQKIDEDVEVHSIAAGFDYPAVGPEHAMFEAVGRCTYEGMTDDRALEAFQDLCRLEGIVPALETSHGIAMAEELAADRDEDDVILVNLSGRGDKDVDKIANEYLADG